MKLKVSLIVTTMKFTVAALLAALATTCFAQTVSITSPLNGTTIIPGKGFPFEVTYNQSLANTVSL